MSEPLVLTFDTSGAYCAACLSRGQKILGTKIEEMAKGQAERLIPLCEDLLANHEVNWGDLVTIGVITGPGNFTGIRIAVSAARGLALALSIPTIGVSRFEALAFDTQGALKITLPARRGYRYEQSFENGMAQDALEN